MFRNRKNIGKIRKIGFKNRKKQGPKMQIGKT